MASNNLIIYEPRGRAFEYSELACNLGTGCVHACLYCYCPGLFRMTADEWKVPRYKPDAVRRFEKAAKSFEGDSREILFSFASDPYMNDESAHLMAEVLPIAEAHRLRVQILTKNPERAMASSADIIKRNGWKLGTTIIFLSESLRLKWEPGAPSIKSRIEGMAAARKAGVSTWVSVEPVIDEEEALFAIGLLRNKVDFIKVGKWNHDKRANQIDWSRFYRHAVSILEGKPHLFKQDVLTAARVGIPVS